MNRKLSIECLLILFMCERLMFTNWPGTKLEFSSVKSVCIMVFLKPKKPPTDALC